MNSLVPLMLPLCLLAATKTKPPTQKLSPDEKAVLKIAKSRKPTNKAELLEVRVRGAYAIIRYDLVTGDDPDYRYLFLRKDNRLATSPWSTTVVGPVNELIVERDSRRVAEKLGLTIDQFKTLLGEWLGKIKEDPLSGVSIRIPKLSEIGLVHQCDLEISTFTQAGYRFEREEWEKETVELRRKAIEYLKIELKLDPELVSIRWFHSKK